MTWNDLWSLFVTNWPAIRDWLVASGVISTLVSFLKKDMATKTWKLVLTLSVVLLASVYSQWETLKLATAWESVPAVLATFIALLVGATAFYRGWFDESTAEKWVQGKVPFWSFLDGITNVLKGLRAAFAKADKKA